ncbi:ABC transporter [Colletotrichum falcatum]|nr:ABC transporter [Colletotrichum falcatum]
MLLVKLGMFLLEIQGKRRFLLAALRNLSPETTSGIVSRGFFWWLNGLLRHGFRANLSPSTLYAVDEGLQSGKLLQIIGGHWDQQRGKGKHALLRSVCNTTKLAFVFTAMPRLVLIGFKFSQPFLMNRIIKYVDGDKKGYPESIRNGLIIATFLIYLGNALSTGFYQHRLFYHITMIRGSLVSLVMTKNLDFYPDSAVDSSVPLTLVSTDVRTICKSFEAIHEVWANPIEIGVAAWLLQRQLGLGSIGPAITIIGCAIGTAKLSELMPRASKIWNEGIQKRITVTTKVLNCIKETKMLGMVNFLQQTIQDLRVLELCKAKQYRTLITYMNLLGKCDFHIVLSLIATFGIAILAQNINAGSSLSIATVFTSLSIIDLIAGPLAQLISSVPSLVASLGSFERIQAFLERSTTVAIAVPRSSSTVEFTKNRAVQSSDGIELQFTPFETPIAKEDVAVVMNGTFALEAGADPILRDINLRIGTSTVTIVTGRVGSGKTTLLRGLLGEISVSGLVKGFERGIAYCSQTTWLIDSTVQDNILGPKDLELNWYNNVLHACALEHDLTQLTHGDQTVVGSNGQLLSGGQKQRVALARAIYSRMPTIVLDDALSGLDLSTQKHIWECLFSPTGLNNAIDWLRSVLLTLIEVNYLGYADNIVILGDNGRIVQQGNLEAIRHSAHLKGLAIENSMCGDSTPFEKRETSGSCRQTESPRREAEADPERDLSRQAGDITLHWYYLKSIGWTYGSASAVFLFLDCFVRVFPQLWLKFWTEDEAETSSADTAMYFGVYCAISLIGLLVIGINIWIMFVMIVPKSSQSMHWTLLKSVMRAPLSFFATVETGDLINRFSQDLSYIDRDLPIALFMTSTAILDCLAGGILIMTGAKYLSIVIPFILIALYCLQAFYLTTSRQMRLLDLQAQAPLLTKLIETVGGLSSIRAFGWQEAFIKTSLDLLDQSQRPYYLLSCIQRWLTLVLDLLVGAIAVLLVSMALMIPNATSPGAIAVALYNVLGFNQSLANLITSWTELETSLGAISRLRIFESQTPTEKSPADEDSTSLPPHWPSQGQIEIKRITASYSAGSKPALSEISLSISPKDKVLICGRTGSGKSSLTLAIYKLLNLDFGSIEIDGIDIARVPTDILRQRLISIPQEPFLFPGTLRTNLYPYHDVLDSEEILSDDSLVTALEKVTLWSLISIRGGLDTDISEIPLSKGQMQLLCLARAIVRKDSSKILILDEATSAVDQETEEVMGNVIESEFTAHTVVSVAHRPEALRGITKVVTMELGRIV